MTFKQVLATVLIAGATSVASVFVYNKYFEQRSPGIYQNGSTNIPVNYTSYIPNAIKTNDSNNTPFDFTYASKVAVPGVVHIRTKTNPRQVQNSRRQASPLQQLFGDDDFWDEFMGNNQRKYYIPGQMASGSGVIISDDGYIVTNNHVVDNADEVTVTLANSNRTYTAKVIGTDPYTDLAVIKIDAKDLPYLVYGNSDDVQVGQWVLAVGYPLNLETTVTAGIVSAKSRTIGINKVGTSNISPIESFIQTDAAVNQGNSGGALINTGGELVGINSAIASPTGSFAGYSYAIPVNLVKKVVADIMQYGSVQRAFLGISYYDPNKISDSDAKELNIRKDVNGVLVANAPDGGAASAAGIKEGDVITKINGINTLGIPQMTEQLARYKPGDKVSVTYLRDNKEHTVNVLLKNRAGTTDIVKSYAIDKLGAELYTVPANRASQFGLNGGVLVGKISSGIIRNQTTMRPGFIIIKAGDSQVTSLEDLQNALQENSKIRLEGIYANNSGNGVYYYDINTNN